MELKKLSLAFKTLRLCGILSLLFSLISCSVPKRHVVTPPHLMTHKEYKEQGIASWYGEDFHGKKTSSGEIYDMHALTAAHKTLPLETYVRITNLHNKQTVVVRINDRGPFVKGRIIDLSCRAAREIDIVETGTAPVELKALGKLKEITVDGKIKQVYVPVDYYAGEFTIQAGSFKEKTNAASLLKRLAAQYTNTYISVYKTAAITLYRVRVARCATLEEATEIKQELIRDGYVEAIIVSP